MFTDFFQLHMPYAPIYFATCPVNTLFENDFDYDNC